SVEDKKVEVETSKDLEKLYGLMNDEEDVILEWVVDGKIKSRLFVTEGMVARLKDGSLILESSEGETPETKDRDKLKKAVKQLVEMNILAEDDEDSMLEDIDNYSEDDNNEEGEE
ncbi:hypothetical protein LCGC14_2005690, partial [marine sediment metagenome]